MPESPDERLREEIAAAVADGTPVDWDRIEREKRLDESESNAFRVIEALRRHQAGGGSGALPPEKELPLETGFEIREEFGRGADGRVFRALDRALGCEVALKIVSGDVEVASDARARFLAEARILASLDHPNIVRVRAIDEVEGRIRIVLDYLRGRTLDRVVAEDGPFAPEEAARIAIDLCRALAAIHGRGLV